MGTVRPQWGRSCTIRPAAPTTRSPRRKPARSWSCSPTRKGRCRAPGSPDRTAPDSMPPGLPPDVMPLPSICLPGADAHYLTCEPLQKSAAAQTVGEAVVRDVLGPRGARRGMLLRVDHYLHRLTIGVEVDVE